MSIAAEALVAASGIFPDEPLGPQDGLAARALEGEWRSQIKTFFERSKPYRFRLYPRPAHEATLDKLTTAPDGVMLTSKLTDPDLAADYLTVLSNAREYVRERWPSLSMETFTGPRLLEPGWTAMAAAWAVLAVVDDPSRLLVEILSATVQTDQVAAVKTVFPNLYQMLLAIIDDRKQIELAKKKSWTVPWAKERVIRILYQLPPDVSISEAPQPPAKSAATTRVRFDFGSSQTRAQRIAAK